jgi:hypothetical protein
VYRFASEYQNTIASATGDSTRQSRFNWPAATMKTTDHATIQVIACAREMIPRGISRRAVRGFRASHHASTSRLNPMAALRAATMAITIHPTCHTVTGVTRAARRAPVRAKGNAKREWLNRTKDAHV